VKSKLTGERQIPM